MPKDKDLRPCLDLGAKKVIFRGTIEIIVGVQTMFLGSGQINTQFPGESKGDHKGCERRDFEIDPYF